MPRATEAFGTIVFQNWPSLSVCQGLHPPRAGGFLVLTALAECPCPFLFTERFRRSRGLQRAAPGHCLLGYWMCRERLSWGLHSGLQLHLLDRRNYSGQLRRSGSMSAAFSPPHFLLVWQRTYKNYPEIKTLRHPFLVQCFSGYFHKALIRGTEAGNVTRRKILNFHRVSELAGSWPVLQTHLQEPVSLLHAALSGAEHLLRLSACPQVLQKCLEQLRECTEPHRQQIPAGETSRQQHKRSPSPPLPPQHYDCTFPGGTSLEVLLGE